MAKKEIIPPDCPYCSNPAELLTGKEVYGLNYKKDILLWVCKLCKAQVGCCDMIGTPKGTLAKKPLRKLRMLCHHLFDRHWHNQKERGRLYKRLANKMGYGYIAVHFGEFTEIQCIEALWLMQTTAWIEYNERKKPAKW